MKIIYVLFLLLASSTLLADEIHLVDTTVHKCTIINVTGDSVEYSTQEKPKEKIAREQLEKIVYANGKEIEFYDRFFLADGSIVKGKVIKISDVYLEYNPAGIIPFEKMELSGITKIIYDDGKVQNFKKAADADADMIYFRDGTIARAKGIALTANNIEFYNEFNIKQLNRLTLIDKIVYRDGRTEYPESKSNDVKQTPSAQKGSGDKLTDMFFEFECGWNGYAGLGARFDALLFDNASFNGAAGFGLWGYRVSGSLRYYLEYPYGLAFSAGVAYNTGSEYEDKIDTQDPGGGATYNEKAKFKFKPVTCINATLVYSFQINGKDKIYIETGYSYAIQKEKYTYTTESGREITSESKKAMDLLAPGGLMITVGYAFAI